VGLGALDADVADGVGLVNGERAESRLRREIRSAHCELEFVSEVRCFLLGEPGHSKGPAAQGYIGVSLITSRAKLGLMSGSRIHVALLADPRAIPRYKHRNDFFDDGKAGTMLEKNSS
jgi:hypothetical protein